MEAPKPEDEVARLKALRRYQVLDTPPEVAFDRLAATAARVFKTPMAMVSLVDENRQWFKACVGIRSKESLRRDAFCAYTILGHEPLIIPDARADVRFVENPLVVGEPFIRFYAGAPLVAPSGHRLGTLCIADTKPREFEESDYATLIDLAAMVVDELEHRLAASQLLQEIERRGHTEEELETRVEQRTRELAMANEALREAEAGAREIVQEAVEGVFQSSPDGYYLSANPALARMYGFDGVAQLLEEVTDLGQQLYVEASARENFKRQMEREGKVSNMEMEVYRRDRSTLWISVTARLVRDPAGCPLYYEGMVTDISEQKLAKDTLEQHVQERTAALQASNVELRAEIEERRRVEATLQQAVAENDRLLAAIQSSDTGLLLTDPRREDNPIIFANTAFERITGYEAAESIGRNCRFLQGPETDRATVREMRQAIAQGESFHGLILNYRKDGTSFWNDIIINPVYGPDGTVVNFVARQIDATDRREQERALRHSKEEAERANRAKSEFLSRMSHELRTPLNAILGFSQLLQLQEMKPEDVENVEFITKAGENLLGLINEVLDLARIDSGRISVFVEPVEVAQVLGEAIGLVREESETAKVTINSALGCGAGLHLLADHERLRQILVNLLSNAVKYNRPGGEVLIVCRRATANQLELAVTDHGSGISPERLERIFMPFERRGVEFNAVEGTGIGLALSQRLARLQGGEILVQSVMGEGSTFTLRMPLVRGDVPSRPVAPVIAMPVAPPPDGSPQQTVLYVEDSPTNVQLMARVVSRHRGWRMVSANCGTAGLQAAREYSPTLIFLDVHLPDFDGDVVLQRLREDAELGRIPVVMVSADATVAQSRRMLEAGAAAFVAKPIDIVEVLQILDEYAARQGG